VVPCSPQLYQTTNPNSLGRVMRTTRIYGNMYETKRLFVELVRRELPQEPRYDASGYAYQNFQFRIVGQLWELDHGVPIYKGLYINYK
jgi:hypothetical protein